MAAAKARIPEGTQDLMADLQKDLNGFDRLATFLRQNIGIDLPRNPKNLTLAATRLAKVMKAKEIATYRQYLDLLQKGDPALMSEFTSALTTNTTHFFRENSHFEVLRNALPELAARLRKSSPSELRVWCAASSTGQEVYTISMVLAETLPELYDGNSRLALKMLATDIDREVLEKASIGLYDEREMEGIPALMQQKYFAVSDGEERQYRVRADLRKAPTFARFNLLESAYPFQHGFDIIFCRNVLIYFDRPTTTAVIDKLVRALRPGGYLFLGHSEAGMVRHEHLRAISHAAYRKVESGGK